MPTQLQLRRGTTVQHSSFTGAVGEVTINTTKKTAVVHDGSTAGGLELLRADMSNIFSSATPTITSLNTSGDVSVGGNLTVTGTSTFNGGTINLGDAAGDNVVFGADINSNIIPNTDNTYNLGSAGQKWANLNVVNITQTGNTTTSGTLTVTGETNLNGGLKLDTDKFTVADTSGNTAIAGTLAVTGETNLNGGLKLDTDKFTVADGTGNTAIAGTLAVTGDTTLTGDLAVNGGDLTTSQTTFNLLNATATTLNIGGASTATSIGAASGTTTIKADLAVDGDIQVKGGDLTTNQTTFNLLNSTATTLNIGGAATSLNLGAATGTTTVGNNLTVTGDLTVNGNTTTLSTSTLEVEDKNILIAKGAANDAAANDAGIVVESGDGNKSILWKDATDAFTSSEHIETAAGKTLALSGSSSGKTTINVAATASGTLTLPSATDTLVGKATTDTFTNKTFDTAGTGNTLRINGNTVSSYVGSGTNVVLSSSPTITNLATTGTGMLFSGSSSGTTTLTAASTASGSLTLPSATDTLIGKATTDTLTNKTINLASNTLTGTTAQFNTALSDDNFATLTGTQTLTNKTLTSPSISTINNSTSQNFTEANNDWGPNGFYAEITNNPNDQISVNTFFGSAGFNAAMSNTPIGTVFQVVYTAGDTATLTQNGASSFFGFQLNIPVSGLPAQFPSASPSLSVRVISSITILSNNTLTFPSATDTLVGRNTTDTLTNKTISFTNNTITATSAQLATAISDETGTGALVFGTSPTLTTPVFSSIVNTGTLTLPTSTDTLVGRATTDTLTNKSISLTTNTISGTLAEFNTALSDGDFATIAGTETLTNKTLTAAKIANGGFIADANGNEQLIFNTTASAVNELTLTNAATGNRPIISATGNDTNIGISIAPKGTGTILVGNSIIPSSDSTMDLGATGAKFRDLYLSGASIIMGTTKIMMHADGYLQFNTNSAGGYPAGSNVSVATAANGVAATNSNALAYSIALGGA